MLKLAELNALADEVRTRLDASRLAAHLIRCGRRLDDITTIAIWSKMSREVLEDGNNNGWLPELLEEIAGEQNSGATLVRACRDALNQWRLAQQAARPLAPTGHRRDALVLFNKAPFIDRATERPLVDEVVHLVGRRVLAVRGQEAVGKSHLDLFIRHLADVQQSVRVATVRLDELEGEQEDERIHARDLMIALAESMNLPVDPSWDVMAQEARQADKLVRWLTGQLNAHSNRGKRWVIVLDQLNHPKVAPGAIELAERLVKGAARGELGETSLVVISLPEVPAAVIHDVIEQEMLPLSLQDVRAHLQDVLRVYERSETVETLQDMMGFLTEGLKFPLHHAGMRTLRKRISQLLTDMELGVI